MLVISGQLVDKLSEKLSGAGKACMGDASLRDVRWETMHVVSALLRAGVSVHGALVGP